MLEGEYLYGVRFEQETEYCLIDIDRGSAYHPQNAPLVIDRLFAAVESLGITDHLACTSSDSDGLHIYFPLPEAFNSWQLSKAISIALENAGFKLKLGQLELFPNPKAYSTDDTPSLFNAHRLPLQMGSYILNNELEPVSGSPAIFVRMWQACQRRNELNHRRIKKLLKKAKQVNYKLSNKASKFLDDLNTEIEEGWTEYGQTNRLLGRITMRSFIFNHITEGGEPLEGKALIERVVSIAKALPGYKDWCRHQHEIKERAAEWARCIENSHYFAYGTARGKYKELAASNQIDSELNYNQKQSQETQAKIIAAVQDLQSRGTLPERATARFKVLLGYSIGGASLYRYRELWHPIELLSAKSNHAEPELQKRGSWNACTEGANVPKTPTSLLSPNDSNLLDSKGLSDLKEASEVSTDSNVLDPAQAIRERIKKQLAAAKKARAITQDSPITTAKNDAEKAIHKRAMQRMREFLLSGESILIAEVGQWLNQQSEAVRNELIEAKNEHLQRLLCDLSEISLLLVCKRLSPWEIRFQLEEHFDKSVILELTDEERRVWIDSLRQDQAEKVE